MHLANKSPMYVAFFESPTIRSKSEKEMAEEKRRVRERKAMERARKKNALWSKNVDPEVGF